MSACRCRIEVPCGRGPRIWHEAVLASIGNLGNVNPLLLLRLLLLAMQCVAGAGLAA